MMRRRTLPSRNRDRRRGPDGTVKGWLFFGVAALAVLFVGWQLYVQLNGRVTLGEDLCPVSGHKALAVVLVDLTDPLSVPQTQDLTNQLEGVRNSVTKHGRLSLYKVAATDQRLLEPVLDVCNPGDGSDVTEATGNPKADRARWQANFSEPLDAAFVTLAEETGAATSPVLESVQSVSLSKLNREEARGKAKKLILVSDLLQNTAGLDFYKRIPSFEELKQTEAYRTSRADLRGVDMELWMLSRPGLGHLQNSELAELWTLIFRDQGARVTRVYNVNG